VSVLAFSATLPKPAVVDAVTDQYRPLASDQQKLTGLLANRLRANSEGYLEHLKTDQLIAPLRDRTEAQNRTGDSGEIAGEFLEAASNAYDYRHDQQLKALMDQTAKDLLAAQVLTGYLGPYSKAPRWDTRDVWVHRHDLLGLLAYYRVTGYENVLVACKKMGDLLVQTFSGAGESGIVTERTHENESPIYVLLEPLIYLYRYTGDDRYLDFCKAVAAAWAPAERSGQGLTHEQLTGLLGLVELYRTSGDESYFRPVLAAWTYTASSQLSLAGAPRASASQEADAADACVTAAWMQLTLNLLRITGEARFGQHLERTIYNQLLASQDPNTGAIFATVQLNGSKNPMSSTDRCAGNETRAITMIPGAVWGRFGRGIAIVQYTGGRATFQLRRRGTVQLYSEATYPETGEILLHVEPSHNIQFPLRLRVPEWTSKFVVDIGGSHLVGRAGDFLTLNRTWKRGDTIKIAIDLSARVMEGGPKEPDRIAIQRGPQILALGRTLNPQIQDLALAGPVSTSASQLKLTPIGNGIPASWTADQAYSVAGEYQDKPQRLILVPFADAIKYRVWIKRPSASSGASEH
jgi:DUF1680 family protein